LEISALSGEGQLGLPNNYLNAPLVLKLETFDEKPVEDEVIGWSVTGPNADTSAAVFGIGSGSETDENGIDTATIRLGGEPGVYTLTLNNRFVTPQSNPSFTFTAVDDIEDTDPEMEHPLLEEAVGENAQQCDSVGNPIGVSAGNKFQREVDIPQVGLSPIEFVRYHNSKGFVSNSFINYWTHTYDRYIEVPANPLTETVKVVRPDGKKINFNWNGSAFEANPGVHSVLTQSAGGWEFSDEDLTLETFDSDGFLIDITDIEGHVQTATYNGSDQLIRIESNSGGSINLTYDAEDAYIQLRINPTALGLTCTTFWAGFSLLKIRTTLAANTTMKT
jgi:YD repeat-containing protein